jgi:hypothetical protein
MNKGPSLKEVQDVYNKYKQFIFREILKETKVKWRIKEIKFQISDKDFWCAETDKGDTIFIGRYYKPKSKILTSIIHEAIHLNTINKKTKDKLMYSKENSLGIETATCIITNMIIDKANKMFKKRFGKNRFDDAYKIYENKSDEFIREKRNKNFFEFFELIKDRIV